MWLRESFDLVRQTTLSSSARQDSGLDIDTPETKQRRFGNRPPIDTTPSLRGVPWCAVVLGPSETGTGPPRSEGRACRQHKFLPNVSINFKYNVTLVGWALHCLTGNSRLINFHTSVQHPVGCATEVTIKTVYATLFIYYPLVEGVLIATCFGSVEPSSSNILVHMILILVFVIH
jgi:hypothetical protein